MDPITVAILAVLPTLASDMVQKAVKDAYEGLKAVIRHKWGESSAIPRAISALEQDPQSKAQAGVLQEKIEAAKATEDSDVATALRKLIDEMKKNNLGGDAVAGIQFNVTGGVVQGIAGSQNVHVGTMSFTNPKS
jgi:hypothetical protein